MSSNLYAPGCPGINPKWTSSAKLGVGTAMSGDSNVWFTLSHGILNEIYYPRVDIANVRDMQFIVTDGKDFFSEEKRDTTHEIAILPGGVPAFQITNTCLEGRYQIEKTIISDPHRNVVLQEVQFIPYIGSLQDFHIYAILAPHLHNAGYDNTGWWDFYKGYPMLFAERKGISLAFASSVPFSLMNCGFVGVNDSWLDLKKNKKMTQFYQKAANGNIALAGEIDLKACGGRMVIAISFAQMPEEAGLQARAALFRDFDLALEEYVSGWQVVQSEFEDLSKIDKEAGNLFRISTAVLKTHEV